MRSGSPESPSGPSRRRVTQEAVDAMERLRRQGLTFAVIGARLGCSERTARRYVGQVEPHIELPGKKTKPDADALREQLAEDFARAAWMRWKTWPSTDFVNEVNRQLEERLAAMRPETLRLLTEDPRMRGQLFAQTVVPLYRDFKTYQEVNDFFGMFPEWEPLFWLPGERWKKGLPDESDEEP